MSRRSRPPRSRNTRTTWRCCSPCGRRSGGSLRGLPRRHAAGGLARGAERYGMTDRPTLIRALRARWARAMVLFRRADPGGGLPPGNRVICPARRRFRAPAAECPAAGLPDRHAIGNAVCPSAPACRRAAAHCSSESSAELRNQVRPFLRACSSGRRHVIPPDRLVHRQQIARGVVDRLPTAWFRRGDFRPLHRKIARAAT